MLLLPYWPVTVILFRYWRVTAAPSQWHLRSELEASGQTIQQHKLNLALEEAKAATVGRQDPPHVLDCVHISMEQAMANDIGWNVIVLDYIVTAPVNAIVTPQAVALYQRYALINNTPPCFRLD